jgi:hypothetical protein
LHGPEGKHRQVEKDIAAEERRAEQSTLAQKARPDVSKIKDGEGDSAGRQDNPHQYFERMFIALFQREQANRRRECDEPGQETEQDEMKKFFHGSFVLL